jgi:hypothetical protein
MGLLVRDGGDRGAPGSPVTESVLEHRVRFLQRYLDAEPAAPRG